MTRIAILADIHGNLAALEAVIADLAGYPHDLVVNLGDHASGPLWPRETIELLMQQNWITIVGNHDRQLVQIDPQRHGASDRYAYSQLTAAQLAWLRELPAQLRIAPDILLCHGTPADDDRYLLETVANGAIRHATRAEIHERLGPTRAAVILCAHSHTARLVTLDPTMLIINPGSVGLAAYQDDTPELHVVEGGSPHARYAMLESNPSGWHVTFRSVAYDHDRAADQAVRNGGRIWEAWLQTGSMGNEVR